MKKKLSNQFLSNYLVIFLSTIAATVLVYFLLVISSALISGALSKNRYPASSLIREDYRLIDASKVIQNGGGVQVVSKDYRVLSSSGLNPFDKSRLTPQEFTDFLLKSRQTPYHHDVLYQPQGEFWLIVTFPTSLRINLSMVSNPEALPADKIKTYGVLLALSLVYLLIIAGFAFVYSRATASSITKPLRKLMDGTKLLREGDYSVRVDLRLKNEFARLQDTFNEMAARIQQEMALRKKSEEDRKRMILDLSHDLKNPLSSIAGYAELLIDQPELSDIQVIDSLQAIRRSSKRANLLLSDMFEYSKLDSPDFQLKRVKTDLSEYLRQVCGDLLPLFEHAGFSYAFDIPDRTIFAMADPDALSRVFHNLADNAVRYKPRETKIFISLSKEKEQAVILFGDDGEGIPAGIAEDIFKPFVRGDDSRSRDSGGSGLGLSIARKIAQAHGGQLTLQTDLAKGCAFRLSLPLL